jgi:hypothetical protein
MNPFSATAGSGLVLPTLTSMSARRGPSPVRSAKEQGDHLFHDTITQPMHALTHINSQRRKAGNDTPKLFRSAAAKVTAFSSVTKMTNSQGPKPIREAGGEAAHLFYDATHSMPLQPTSPNKARYAGTGADAQPNRVREADGNACHLFHATSTQHMHDHQYSKGHRCVRESCLRKTMGVTIQLDSHRYELPAILNFEHAPLVLKFYDQPSLGNANSQPGTP